MIILLLLFFLISPQANAAFFAVEQDDGSVALVNYVEGSGDTLEDVIDELKLPKNKIVKVKESVFPNDDIEFWQINDVPIGGKLKVNQAKKQAHLDKIAQKEAEKALIFEKLKITKEEFEKIKDK